MELCQSWKVIVFTTNLIIGLIFSQIVGATLHEDMYHTWVETVTLLTMWCLSFIMVNVGYEFTIDKCALSYYAVDYCIAMTAAGFPWAFVGAWFYLAMGIEMKWEDALLIARFAAPTSAGILFSMLAAAGLKDSWVFQKARILAIFDDLDTIVLMIPLKIAIVGVKWELGIAVSIMFVLLVVAWKRLHAWRMPYTWPWTLLYAGIITILCKAIHHITHHYIEMEAIHIEVLLPAFVAGCVIDTPCARHELVLQRRYSEIRRLSKTSLFSESGTACISDSTPSKVYADETAAPPSPQTENSGGSPTNSKGGAEGPRVVSKGNVNGWVGGCENGLRTNGSKSCMPPSPDVDKQTSEELAERNKSKSSDHSGAPSIVAVQANKNAAAVTIVVEGPPPTVSTQPIQPRQHSKDSKNSNKDSPKNSPNGKDQRTGSKLRTMLHLPIPQDPDDVRRGTKESGTSKQSGRSNTSNTSMTRYGAPRIKPQEPDSRMDEAVAQEAPESEEEESVYEQYVQTAISIVFMLLVGMSMPAMVGKNAKDYSRGISPEMIIFHVTCVSILMIIGKMFCIFCYKEESHWKQRLALCLGMCPRGEVGASIIVISLELGVEGPAIIVALSALGINLVMSGGFIACVKCLVRSATETGKSQIEAFLEAQKSNTDDSQNGVSVVEADMEIKDMEMEESTAEHLD